MIIGLQNRLYVCVLKPNLLESSQHRIIIRQEYRQEHGHSKDASHADNQELAEVFTSIHPLYPIPGICHIYKSWQGFNGLWYW